MRLRLLLTTLQISFSSFFTYGNVTSDSIYPTEQRTIIEQTTLTDSTDKPNEIYNEFTYIPPKSTFCIPIEIEIKTLQKTLNESLEGLIYEDNQIEDDSLKLKVWKNGTFKVNYVNDTLTTSIPIKIWAQKRFGIMGLSYTDREIDAAITVRLQSRLQVSKSWSIISKTKFIDYVWDKKPTTKVASLEIPLTYIVDKIISSNKSDLEKLIDENIKSKIPTQEYAIQLWQQLQEPIPVAIDSYKAWISLRPANILMKPIKGEEDRIKTGFKVDCNVDVTMGDNPVNSNFTSTLPECKLYSNMEPGWTLNLLANIPYSVMDSLSILNLKDQPIGEGRHSVYVDKVNTYGSGEQLAIELMVHGYIKGSIYLIGTPYYDKHRVSIRLKDVAYSFKTKNILHKTLNAVIKPILKNIIEKKVEISMKDNFYLIEQMGQSELLNSQWANNFYTSGRITKVEGGDIFITKAGIQAAINIEGDLTVSYK